MVGKELLKLVVLTVAALVATWLLAILGNILQVDPTALSWEAVWQKIKISAQVFLDRPVAYSVQSVTDDPIRTISTIVLVSGYLILFVLLRRAHWRIKEASVERLLAVQAGIGGRWPHARTDGEGGAPWPDLCAEIARPDNNILYLLGANGAETFGEPKSPLYQVMTTFHGQVHVVLADPDSEHTAARARAVKANLTEYKRAVRTSVARLRTLRGQLRAVEGRYYTGQPNWKMIITSRTAWVQYYLPHGGHVNETAVWRFDATPNGTGLYHIFQMEFERVWRRCERNPMELG